MERSHYSFGDNSLAALRLEYLAAAFEPSSRRFLSDAKPERVELALDLGSGIGVTTALLWEVTGAARVIGYERSASYLALARERNPKFQFREVDVLDSDYPDREVDLTYCRFLLTHLHRPEDVLSTGVRHLRVGGRLLIEETAGLSSPVPALARYYELLAEMQAHHQQETLIGNRLASLAAGIPNTRVTAELRELPLAASEMARLHAMNIATWKSDAFMLATHRLPVMEELERELTAAAGSSGLPDGRCVIAQVTLQRL